MEQDDYQRPDPDRLLESIVHQEQKKNIAGKLKIFFGYAAGVGKTYAMLEEAHTQLAGGVDVIIGYIEPHTRPETLELIKGLEMLPPTIIPHRNLVLKEFDLDAALKRSPQLILVDELAHTNAESCRHRKRYQDVEELLAAGIDVYTTVNVQHLESLNDIVASITGIIVRERLPDKIFDEADQVRLVDIEPDELIERLSRGKIYRDKQARLALNNFFSKENLIALREISLRRTADRITRKAEKTCSEKMNFRTEEHVLICLSPSPSNAKVIRTAARMKDAFHGTFTALLVQATTMNELSEKDRKNLKDNQRLAELLGAKVAKVYGDDIAEQISEYAKISGVTKIVLGRTNTIHSLFHRSATLSDRLIELAPDVDIYIIPDKAKPYQPPRKPFLRIPRITFSNVAISAAILIVSTLLGFLFYHWEYSDANIIMVYILGTLMTAALTIGRVYCVVSSLISVFLFNYFFVEPRFSLQSYQAESFITYIVMFFVSLVISTFAKQVKIQARQNAQKAYRTEILLESSQKFQRAESAREIFDQTAAQIVRLFNKTVIIYPVESESLGEPFAYPRDNETRDFPLYISEKEKAVAEWVRKNHHRAGATTDTLPSAKCLYLAIRNHAAVFGVVGIAMDEGDEMDAFDYNLLIALITEMAMAMEKMQVAADNMRITLERQQDQMREGILRAISHDLRTPLTSISGNAAILQKEDAALSSKQRMELYTTIYDDSIWLINLVENLLSITRIENGAISLHIQPEMASDVINEALKHVDRRVEDHQLKVHIPNEFLMANMDSRLIIQVLINLINNSIKYTQKGSTILIRAVEDGEMARISIADDGPGISEKDSPHIFELFYSGNNKIGDSRRGIGLGLSLCQSIISAHGGQISVQENRPKGAIFSFTLPIVKNEE